MACLSGKTVRTNEFLFWCISVNILVCVRGTEPEAVAVERNKDLSSSWS